MRIPLSVPVSYGFDATSETFYFRLATGSDTAKGELDGRPVSFVTYGSDDGVGRSVIARGRLTNVERGGIETESLAGLERVDVPLIDMFREPVRDVSFEICRLDPEELTGRVEADGGS